MLQPGGEKMTRRRSESDEPDRGRQQAVTAAEVTEGIAAGSAFPTYQLGMFMTPRLTPRRRAARAHPPPDRWTRRRFHRSPAGRRMAQAPAGESREASSFRARKGLSPWTLRSRGRAAPS